MIISKTPVRLSLFGGGTDYREYYERCGGAILGTTIDKYIFTSLNRLSDFFDYKIRLSYSKIELVNSPKKIVHPSVRECLLKHQLHGNLDIHIFADLPARTGLGSSSSFTVGFLNALHAMNGRRLSKQHLAEEACYVEQELINENVGSQDQFHAAFGGLNIMEFGSKGIHVRPVIISEEKKYILQNNLLVFFTGISRMASKIAEEQVNNTANQSKDSILNQIHQMVYEAEELFTEVKTNEITEKIGHLLHKGWELKKCLSTKISNDQIDELYEKAIGAGAYGGKIAGAGSGGFIALLAPSTKHNNIRKALGNLLEVKFNFEDQGSTIVYSK